MPGGQLTYDQLYNGAAANKPGLTQEQFIQDMGNGANSYKLYTNIKAGNASRVPPTYKGFVQLLDEGAKNYQSQKQTKTPVEYGYANPQWREDNINQSLQEAYDKEQKQQNDTYMLTGLFNRNQDGSLSPKNPQTNIPAELDKQAETTFKGLVKGNYNNSLFNSYVDAYYKATNDADRNALRKKINDIWVSQDPNAPQESKDKPFESWSPVTPKQYEALKASTRGMYMSYLAQKNDIESRFTLTPQEQEVVKKVDSGQESLNTLNPSDKQLFISANNKINGTAFGEKQKELKALDDYYGTFAKARYYGQGVAQDPDYFWGQVGQSAAKSATFGLWNPQTDADYNEKLKAIYTQAGIPLATKEGKQGDTIEQKQKEAFNPTTWQTIRQNIGAGTGFILPMVATSFMGEAMGMNDIASGMTKSESAFTRFTGRTLNNSFSSTAPMILSDVSHPLLGGINGMAFAATDAALSKIGLKATDNLGVILGKYLGETTGNLAAKGIVGAGKGLAAGGTAVGADMLWKAGYKAVLSSSEFDKTFGTENKEGWNKILPSTREAIASVATMGIFGFGHSFVTPENIQEAHDDLVKNGLPDLANEISENYTKIEQQEPKNAAAINAMKDGNPAMAKPLQQTASDVKEPAKAAYDVSESPVKVSQGDPAEIGKQANKANSKGERVIRMNVTDEKGNVTGEQMISFPKEYEGLARRTEELIRKGNDITPKEQFELGVLTGHEPKKYLSDLIDKAPEELKPVYQKQLDHINKVTAEGNNAGTNGIAILNKQWERAIPSRKEELNSKIATEALKLGYELKYNEDTKKIDVYKEGEKIGDKVYSNPKNIKKVVEEVQNNKSPEIVKSETDKDGLTTLTDSKGRVVVKDNEGNIVTAPSNPKEPYMSPNDFEGTSDKLGDLKDIVGNSGGTVLGKIVIPDMTERDMNKGWQDWSNGKNTYRSEKVLQGLNQMVLDDKFPLKDGSTASFEDLKTLDKYNKPTQNSPVNYEEPNSPVSDIKDDKVGSETALNIADHDIEEEKPLSDLPFDNEESKSEETQKSEAGKKTTPEEETKQPEVPVLGVNPITGEGKPVTENTEPIAENTDKKKETPFISPDDIVANSIIPTRLKGKQDFKDLTPHQQSFLKSDKDVIYSYAKTISKLGTVPDKVKPELSKMALDYASKANDLEESLRSEENPATRDEKRLQVAQDRFTAQRLSEISNSIRSGAEGQRDIKAWNKILADKSKFKNFKGEEIKATNLAEHKLIENLQKPKKPLTKEEKADMEKRFSGENYEYKALYSGEKNKSPVADITNHILNSVRNMQFYHNYLPEPIRNDGYNLYRKFLSPMVRERASNMHTYHSLLNETADIQKYPKEDWDKVMPVVKTGWFTDNHYYSNSELSERGLNENQVDLYNNLVHIANTAKNFHQEAARYFHDYPNMTEKSKRAFDDTFRSYMNANNGWMPFYRSGKFSVTYHGLDPESGQERMHYERFPTEESANKRAEELYNTTYEVNGEKKRYTAIGKDDNKIEGKPLVREYKELSPEDIKKTSWNDLATLEEFKGLMEAGSEGQKQIDLLLGNLRKAKTTPSFLSTNKVPGADISRENLLHSLGAFGERGIHALARAKGDFNWNENSQFLQPKRFQEYKDRYQKWHDRMLSETANMEAAHFLQNAMYFGYLSFKPAFFAQQMGHSLNVYAQAGVELDNLAKSDAVKKELGQATSGKTLADMPSLLFAREWTNAAAMTDRYIETKGLAAPIKGVQKLIYKTGGLLSGKTSQHAYDEFMNSDRGQTIQKLIDRGVIGHQFYNSMLGRESGADVKTLKSGKSGEKTSTNIQGWSTGYADIFGRMHAAMVGSHIGELKGLKGNDLLNFTEDFVDKTRFIYGKAADISLLRPSKAGNKAVAQAENLIKSGLLTFKQFHLNTGFFLPQILKESDNKAKTIARYTIPRIAIGGAFTAVPMGYLAKWAVAPPWSDKNADTELRNSMIKEYGEKEGNQISDAILMGLPSLEGRDLRGTVDGGTIFRENMPLIDNLLGTGFSAGQTVSNVLSDAMNGEWNEALRSLPGMTGDIAKTMNWLHIMDNKRTQRPGQKSLYQDSYGVTVPPSYNTILSKTAGLSTTDIEKYYGFEDIKQKFVGADGRGGLKDGITKQLFDKLHNDYEGNKKDFDEYIMNPTDDNFIKAFGKGLYDKIEDYNTELYNQSEAAIKAMNPEFTRNFNSLRYFRNMGIGITYNDKTWAEPNTELQLATDLNYSIRKQIEQLNKPI